jgi:hypothetical protein
MIISQIQNMPDNFEIIFFGDNQHGNIAEAEDKYLDCIRYITENENVYGVHMGDICDAFWVDDKRYCPETCKSPPLEQMKHQIEVLTPVVQTKRLLTILEGNHEHALQNKVGNFTNTLCEWLRLASGCQYPIAGSFTHKLELLTEKGSPMFKVFCTHGKKSIRSISPDPHRRIGYLRHTLQRHLEHMAGDCIVMVKAHVHIVLVAPPVPTLYLTTERGKIKQHYTRAGLGKTAEYIPPEQRWYGCSGSFLRSQVIGVNTYSELAEYNPLEIGYLKLIVKDREPVELQEVKV